MKYYVGYGNYGDDCSWYHKTEITSKKMAFNIMNNIALNWWIREHSFCESFPSLEMYYKNNNEKLECYRFKIRYNFWDENISFYIKEDITNN